MASESKQNIEMAEAMDVDRTIVNRGRRRFAEKRLPGIEKDVDVARECRGTGVRNSSDS